MRTKHPKAQEKGASNYRSPFFYLRSVTKKEKIYFFKEDIRFRINHAGALKKWIGSFFSSHKITIQSISYIFCSDKYLRRLNKKYLRHDYYTDVITFDNSVERGRIEADIYISIHRVSANAKKYKTTFDDELRRVIIHGGLHLAGYEDKTEKQKTVIRKAEDFWLSQFEK